MYACTHTVMPVHTSTKIEPTPNVAEHLCTKIEPLESFPLNIDHAFTNNHYMIGECTWNLKWVTFGEH